jgi:EF-P beta-lysylation protein EpmB
MTKTNMTSKATAWQKALIEAITDPAELLNLLELDESLLAPAQKAIRLFPLMVPRSYVARMEKGNPHDPLLHQVLPLGAELIETQGYEKDPLHEAEVNPVPGLLHKYQGRVLLTTVGTCAVNCRFCFRRHFPYAENNPGTEGWSEALAYIAKDDTISEVILSGGDPLISNDKTLQNFSDKLNKIAHVQRLRIHSRVPIVLPERITGEFIAWIKQLKQKPVLIIHCNHPREINAAVIAGLQKLAAAGVMLLNQSVLLTGVNDNADTLIALSEKLFSAGVLPSYIHLLDKVQNVAHFDMARENAVKLYQEMSRRLSGYLVPKWVYEQAGAEAKVVLPLYTG